jgi:CRISPR/Cas system-associated protein Cas10 (large subunit of type III CRISPR-Cas system)
MGPNLLFHLAGGEGGIQHFMQHLSGPVATWWKDLGAITEFSSEVKQTIVNGVLKQANGRSIAELERERDGMLLELLATRSKGERAAHSGTNAAAD